MVKDKAEKQELSIVAKIVWFILGIITLSIIIYCFVPYDEIGVYKNMDFLVVTFWSFFICLHIVFLYAQSNKSGQWVVEEPIPLIWLSFLISALVVFVVEGMVSIKNTGGIIETFSLLKDDISNFFWGFLILGAGGLAISFIVYGLPFVLIKKIVQWFDNRKKLKRELEKNKE